MSGRVVNMMSYSHRTFVWRTSSSFTSWLNQDYPLGRIDFCMQISFRCLQKGPKKGPLYFQTLTHGWLIYTFLVSVSFWREPYLITFCRCQIFFFFQFSSQWNISQTMNSFIILKYFMSGLMDGNKKWFAN